MDQSNTFKRLCRAWITSITVQNGQHDGCWQDSVLKKIWYSACLEVVLWSLFGVSDWTWRQYSKTPPLTVHWPSIFYKNYMQECASCVAGLHLVDLRSNYGDMSTLHIHMFCEHLLAQWNDTAHTEAGRLLLILWWWEPTIVLGRIWPVFEICAGPFILILRIHGWKLWSSNVQEPWQIGK